MHFFVMWEIAIPVDGNPDYQDLARSIVSVAASEPTTTLQTFSHEDAGHFSPSVEGVLSSSQLFETHRLVEKYCADRRVYVDLCRSVLSRSVLGSREQGRTNSTSGKIAIDVDCCAMLAPYEGVGGETCNAFILVAFMRDCNEEEYSILYRAGVAFAGSKSTPVAYDFRVVSLCTE